MVFGAAGLIAIALIGFGISAGQSCAQHLTYLLEPTRQVRHTTISALRCRQRCVAPAPYLRLSARACPRPAQTMSTTSIRVRPQPFSSTPAAWPRSPARGPAGDRPEKNFRRSCVAPWSTIPRGAGGHDRCRYAAHLPLSGARKRQGAALRHRRRPRGLQVGGRGKISPDGGMA